MQFKNLVYICSPLAGVVELVDTLDLGSSAARCGSSSLPARTVKEKLTYFELAFLLSTTLGKIFCYFIYIIYGSTIWLLLSAKYY